MKESFSSRLIVFNKNQTPPHRLARAPGSSTTIIVALLGTACATPISETDLEGMAPDGSPLERNDDEDMPPTSGTGGQDGGGLGSGGSGPGGATGTGGETFGTGGGTSGSGGGARSTGGTTGNPPVPSGCDGIKVTRPGHLQGQECVPECSPGFGTGGDWGWENGASCIVAGSSTANASAACVLDGETIQEGVCPPPGSFNCPGNASCGCEIVSGLGANKVALWEAGASVVPYMLAAAMMETYDMSTDYPFGDNKSGDAFNAGVCKQNWGMIRACHAPWGDLENWQFNTSAALNTDRSLDVEVFLDCREHYGDDWWTYHRQGLGYTKGSDPQREEDVQRFKDAMDWTHCLLPGHYSDDVRFWVDVSAI